MLYGGKKSGPDKKKRQGRHIKRSENNVNN